MSQAKPQRPILNATMYKEALAPLSDVRHVVCDIMAIPLDEQASCSLSSQGAGQKLVLSARVAEFSPEAKMHG